MVASTIINSGGPGSPTELSPVTIAVRDKVIERFQDQPLREMNESLKMLLSKEQDEQKRLGILAARVYILRQRIARLADPEQERVVSATSPKLHDTDAARQLDTDAGDDTNSEWTRVRVLDDCEVNGVRFPKTVIIDVKSSDAQRLIDSGNAELAEELPEASDEPTVDETASQDQPSAMQAELDAAPADGGVAADMPADADSMGAAEDEASAADMPDVDIPATEPSPTPESADEAPKDMAVDVADDEDSKEAVIEAPSAAEVTAALAALGAGPDEPDEPAATASKIGDVSDLAAALTETSQPEPADATGSEDDEAATVAAELEAVAAAMAAPSSPADDSDADGDGKPSGWFEAQQNAEKAARTEATDDQDDEGPADEKS